MTDAGIKDNLRSAGCSRELIDRFEHSEDDRIRLNLLVGYRKDLLERIHNEQTKLNCLDYLIFGLKSRK